MEVELRKRAHKGTIPRNIAGRTNWNQAAEAYGLHDWAVRRPRAHDKLTAAGKWITLLPTASEWARLRFAT